MTATQTPSLWCHAREVAEEEEERKSLFFCRQQKRMAFCTVATFLKEREKKGAKILMQQCREGKEAFVEKKAPSPPPPFPQRTQEQKMVGWYHVRIPNHQRWYAK